MARVEEGAFVLSCVAEGCAGLLHADCARALLTRSAQCPTCRRPVAHVAEGAQEFLAREVKGLRRDMTTLRAAREEQESTHAAHALLLCELRDLAQWQAVALQSEARACAAEARVQSFACAAEVQIQSLARAAEAQLECIARAGEARLPAQQALGWRSTSPFVYWGDTPRDQFERSRSPRRRARAGHCACSARQISVISS